VIPASTLGPTAYWYLTRATGVVALLLLSASVVLGLVGSVGVSKGPRWPRFATDSLHRDVSLLVIVVLVLHVLSTVLDGFAPINLLAAVVPFTSAYRPLWLGLGAVSFDLILALALTSLVRRRLGYRTWRAIHWLAYASWPIAVLHGLGTGSDSRQAWALGVTFGCVAVVAGTVVWRIIRATALREGRRSLAVVATLLTPLGVGAFTVLGPLQPGWARRAGTPARLLAGTVATPARTLVAQRRAVSTLKVPFVAALAGTIKDSSVSGGAVLDLTLQITDGARGTLRVRIAGAPTAQGGLSMTGSQVDLLAAGLPAVMQGQIAQLDGDAFTARVTGTALTPLDLRASLQIDNQTGGVSGRLSAVDAR
jgi:methionine sulfoxide reductase heme-binding subunit